LFAGVAASTVPAKVKATQPILDEHPLKQLYMPPPLVPTDLRMSEPHPKTMARAFTDVHTQQAVQQE
jgi:hypothetical protein